MKMHLAGLMAVALMASGCASIVGAGASPGNAICTSFPELDQKKFLSGLFDEELNHKCMTAQLVFHVFMRDNSLGEGRYYVLANQKAEYPKYQQPHPEQLGAPFNLDIDKTPANKEVLLNSKIGDKITVRGWVQILDVGGVIKTRILRVTQLSTGWGEE